MSLSRKDPTKQPLKEPTGVSSTSSPGRSESRSEHPIGQKKTPGRRDKNISPFHLANFSSALLIPIITLFIFNIKTQNIELLPYRRGLN
jgi:hypothetical protein